MTAAMSMDLRGGHNAPCPPLNLRVRTWGQLWLKVHRLSISSLSHSFISVTTMKMNQSGSNCQPLRLNISSLCSLSSRWWRWPNCQAALPGVDRGFHKDEESWQEGFQSPPASALQLPLPLW
jgi:hypothetical protein